MREILFKAKRVYNGEWVEGNLVLTPNADEDFKAIIIPFNDNGEYTEGAGDECLGFETWYKVDMTTICQYTGLTDKNGNKIWENDVCQYVNSDVYGTQEEILVVKYGRHAESCKINIGFYIDWIKANYYRSDLVFWAENRNIEVIGNIFDNPELIKECD